MKIQLSRILDARPILQDMYQTRLTIATAHSMHKLIEECNIAFSLFEKERIALLDEYGKKDKETGNYSVPLKPKKKYEEFKTKMKDMLQAEIELPDITFAIDELQPCSIEPGQIPLIDWIIKK
jgi:hypothetical protein